MQPAIYFDLDGTLTDPRIGITRCIQYALRELDCDVPEADKLLWCIGPPLLQSFEKLLDAERAPRALALYRERFADVGLYENEIYAGIRELLPQLRASGYQLQVASSKPQVFVTRILDHFEISRCFDAVFGSELDGTRTDKTELLAHALRQTGHSAAQACMVGDRKHDAIGARNNQLRFIGVLYGYGDAAELSQAGAWELVDAPAQLRSVFCSTSQ